MPGPNRSLWDIYMCFWNEILLERSGMYDIIVYLYKRYKDDINLALELGNPTWIDKNTEEPRDLMLMKKVKEIANRIEPSIKVTIDCCSNHEDQKTPILDVKVWVEELQNNEV